MNRIKLLREEKGLYLKDIAKVLNTSITAITYYENEKRDIPNRLAIQLANYFNVSLDYLLGNSNLRRADLKPNSIIEAIPVVGKIAAGEPILAEENIEYYLPINREIYRFRLNYRHFFPSC